MTNWIKKLIRNINEWSFKGNSKPELLVKDSIRHSASMGEGMSFTVYNATGGKVIQFSTYDIIKDKHYNSLYIVTDKEDLGTELGQIITKESLTR